MLATASLRPLLRQGTASLKQASRLAAPAATRWVQTAADSTSLAGQVPSSGSEPFKIKLHEEYFHSYKCDPPALEHEVTKDGLIEAYRLMATMRRMEQAADQVRACS